MTISTKLWDIKKYGYISGDFGLSINKAVYTFRLSGFDSKMDANTFVIPSFIEDPYITIQKNFNLLLNISQIGFVGHASNSWSKWIKEVLVLCFI
jgi:hypothetical protein